MNCLWGRPLACAGLAARLAAPHRVRYGSAALPGSLAGIAPLVTRRSWS